jgi:hypothetical protein
LGAKRYIVNAFIAVAVAVIVIDTLPQCPGAVRRGLTPVLTRLGVNQGYWDLFAPEPDRANTRIRAEITYRDGEKRTWHGPDWAKVSIGEKWAGHRRFEWYDHAVMQSAAPAWEPWCRHLARIARPNFPDAERGAEVQIIYTDAITAPAEERPWATFRTPAKFEDGWVLTIEKFE